MRAPERRWHVVAWGVIGPACVVAVVAGVLLREREAEGTAALDAPMERAGITIEHPATPTNAAGVDPG